MTNPAYMRALTRSDLSQFVVHFIRGVVFQPDKLWYANEVFCKIINEGQILPSQSPFITRFCPSGATCFYDAPPNVWPEIISTNPSARQPLGIIVSKQALWSLGGRPAIYTENSTDDYWPIAERYRIVHTDLMRQPQPIDWTHEREWRLPGPLFLYQPPFNPTFGNIWWWPLVPSEDWLQYIWVNLQGINAVFVMSLNRTVTRNKM
jgi:hypothetical protein